MKASTAARFASKLLLIPMATSVTAGISGDSETRLQIDSSRFDETETSLEQWTTLYYKDLSSNLRMGVQFAFEANEQDVDERLYQCYLHSGEGDERPQLIIGRFEHIDSSGFHALDGISIQQSAALLTWKLYSGKPRRFEAYVEDDADLILGLGAGYDLYSLFQPRQFRRLQFNLGLERRWSQSGKLNLRWSLGGERPEVEEGVSLRDFHLATDVSLDDQSLRRLIIDTRFDLQRQGDLRLAYQYYLPDEDPETFRDRYHGFYSIDRQSVLKSVWYLPKRAGIDTRFEITGSRQEQGHGGLGLAAELIYATRHGPILDGRIDYLEIAQDQATSIYLRYRHPVSPFSTIEAESVYQTKQTQLSGNNHVTGFSFSFTQRLIKQVTLNMSGEWLDHSDREDEYRVAASVRYGFYQTNTGELP